MRSNTLDAARRAFLSIARGVIVRTDDSKRMQEAEVRVLRGESMTVERPQAYGVSSVPLPAGSDGRGAEVVLAFENGNRSHGVIVATDDRRHRPKDLKPGEVALYDDQGQTVHLTREGLRLNGGTAKLPIEVTVGNATVHVEDGKLTADVGGMKIIVTPSRVDLGGPGGSRVGTEAGFSNKVFAVL